MLYFNLILLLVYSGLLQQQVKVNCQIITTAALGCSFHLGMLYDMRDDQIVAGPTLWDPQTLANNRTTHKEFYTGFEIITEDYQTTHHE